jgi:hypothetical protein
MRLTHNQSMKEIVARYLCGPDHGGMVVVQQSQNKQDMFSRMVNVRLPTVSCRVVALACRPIHKHYDGIIRRIVA